MIVNTLELSGKDAAFWISFQDFHDAEEISLIVTKLAYSLRTEKVGLSRFYSACDRCFDDFKLTVERHQLGLLRNDTKQLIKRVEAFSYLGLSPDINVQETFYEWFLIEA